MDSHMVSLLVLPTHTIHDDSPGWNNIMHCPLYNPINEGILFRPYFLLVINAQNALGRFPSKQLAEE